jgi:hypothetical protein
MHKNQDGDVRLIQPHIDNDFENTEESKMINEDFGDCFQLRSCLWPKSIKTKIFQSV